MSNTTATNPTLIIMPKDYIIWTLNNNLNKINLPAIIVMAILMVFGTFGNGFTIYIFRFRFKQTSVHIFIAWLAIFDMISCCMSIPFELFEMRFPLMYGEPISCKVFRIIGFTAAITAALIMIFIAFDRYYTLCNPFHRFTSKKAKVLILIGFLIALLFAWPSAIIMGSRHVPTEVPGIVGTDCSYDESLIDTVYPTIYYFILVFSVILIIIILVVVYIKIAIGIWKWKHTDVSNSITGISNSIVGISSISAAVVDKRLFSNRRKRHRSDPLSSTRAFSSKFSPQTKDQKHFKKAGEMRSNHYIPESPQDVHTNGKSMQSEEIGLVLKNEYLKPKIDTSPQNISIGTIFKKIRRCLSLDDLNDIHSYKIQKELNRNISVPDFLSDSSAVRIISSTQKEDDKTTQGVLVSNDNQRNSNTNTHIESDKVDETRDDMGILKNSKRRSSAGFRSSDNGGNLYDKSDDVISSEGRTLLSDGTRLRSDVRNLRNCLSLDSPDTNKQKENNEHGKHRRVTLSLSEMSEKSYHRQSSSSTVRSFTRQASVKDRARVWRSNAIFIAITVVFILSYLPFFILEILRRTEVIMLESDGLLANQLFEVFTKSQYLNNVANPFIYGMLNSKFRKEIKKLFCGRL